MSKTDKVLTGFKFLSDNAVQKIEGDRLKHQSLANVLKGIVTNCPLPFTIGLFGKWGTGKSSISNFLSDILLLNSEKVAIVEFDVWKYEDDSLRRYFLLNLVKKLKDREILDHKLDERLVSSTSRSFEGALKLSWSKLAQFKFYLLAFFLVIISGAIIAGIYSQVVLSAYLTSVFSLSLTTSAMLFLFEVGSEIFTTETKTLSQDRFKDAYEFENEFDKIISKIQEERVLIIIDNLDRCTSAKAVEVLSTIKTFLEPKSKKCIFLVLCDEDAIKKHLECIYTNNLDSANPTDGTVDEKPKIFDSDEFLRKFFNTSIKIPPFIDADLEVYTKELLKETSVDIFDNNSDLVSVITQAFRENPRQIKQFINTLLSHYLMALERESGSDPVINISGIITSNPQFLAKLLIIRQKWPIFYDRIVANPKYIDDMRRESNDIISFMRGTNIVKTDNLRAFIYFKQSTRILALPGGVSESLKIGFEDNKEKEVAEIIKETMSKGATSIQITDFISELLQDNENSKQNLINIINLTSSIRKSFVIEITKNFSELILRTINKELVDQIHTLDLDFIFLLFKSSRSQIRDNVISRYLNLLNKSKSEAIKIIPDYPVIIKKLAENMSNNLDLFSSKQAEISKALTSVHYDDFDVLNSFAKNSSTSDEYISSDLLIKIVSTLSDSDINKAENNLPSIFDKKFDFILKNRKSNWTAVVEPTIVQLTSMINNQISNPDSSSKQIIFESILNKLEIVVGLNYSQIKNITLSNSLATVLMQVIANNIDPLERNKVIKILFYLSKNVGDNEKLLITQTIKSYAKSADTSMLINLFEISDKQFITDFFQSIKDDLEIRSLLDKQILDFTWKYEKEDDKSNLIVNLINSTNYLFATTKLKEVDYSITNAKLIVESLLNKAKNLPVLDKRVLYETVNSMDCANDKVLREELLNQLKSLIVDPTSSNPELSFSIYNESRKFISNIDKLKFTVELIEWLNTQDPININHKYALKTAFLYWLKISNTYKDNLITILFDKVIAKSTSSDEINMAFDLAYYAKPSYAAYKPHFDIAYSRAENETNVPLKDVIKVGLLKLKPKRKSKNQFWSKVNKL